MVTFPYPPTNMRGARSAQIRLASSRSQSQLTDFSQPTLPVRDVTHIPGPILYLGF